MKYFKTYISWFFSPTFYVNLDGFYGLSEFRIKRKCVKVSEENYNHEEAEKSTIKW